MSKHQHGQMPQTVLNLILPPKNGIFAHETGHYHEYRLEKNRLHHGIDLNYEGGQRGINMQHPSFQSPVEGMVVEPTGKSAWGTVAIQDKNGFIHQFLHTHEVRVKVGDKVEVGTELGTMGGRSPKGLMAQHVHYQIRNSANKTINPNDFWYAKLHQDKNIEQAHLQQTCPSAVKASVQLPVDKSVKKNNPEIEPEQNSLLNEKQLINCKVLSDKAYAEERFKFLVQVENPKKLLNAHFDGKSIAIGAGFDLLQHNNDEIDLVFARAGLQELSLEQRVLLNSARQQCKQGDFKTVKNICGQLDLQLPNEKAIEKVFNASIGEYEHKLNRLLQVNKQSLPPSNERLALLSMAYHGTLKNRNSGPDVLRDIKEALHEGDRTQIWRSIHNDSGYTNHTQFTKGFAARAQQTAKLFNLQDPLIKNVENTPLDELGNWIKKYTAEKTDLIANQKTTQLAEDKNKPNKPSNPAEAFKQLYTMTETNQSSLRKAQDYAKKIESIESKVEDAGNTIKIAKSLDYENLDSLSNKIKIVAAIAYEKVKNNWQDFYADFEARIYKQMQEMQQNQTGKTL